MGGLFGGGGGETTIIPASSATSNNPGPGQVFQPPGQQQAAGLFQGLENQLNNLGWSGLSSLPGGVTAPTQLYPQFQGVSQGIAGVNPDIPGYAGNTYAWGPYGNVALTGALDAANYIQNLTSPAFNNQVNQFLPLGSQAAGNVYANAYNPLFGSAVGNLANNPYIGEEIGGALTEANLGSSAAQLLNQYLGGLANNAPYLTGAGGQAAGMTVGAASPLGGLQAGQAGLAGQLSGEAMGLNPQLAALYGQTIPGLEGLAAALPGQTGALGQQAANLYGNLAPRYGETAQGVQSGIAGSNQNIQNLLSSLGPQQQGLADWAQRAARTNTTNINNLLQQTVPGIEQAAAGVSALGNRSGYGLGAMPAAARQILQTGLDPQHALFNQQQQQLTDQSNAVNAMSGLASSPYGAGLTSQALGNFDINWQNQQLQRQATADQAAQGLFGQTAANAATKAGIQAQGAGLLNTAGQLGGALEQQILGGKLAGGQQAANILNQAGNLGLAGQGQIQSGLLGAGGLGLSALQGQANLGMGTQAQELQALLGGSAGAGNLLSQAGNQGIGIAGQQLANLTGAGNIYNQQAQGAGALGSTIGGLAGQELNQQIAGQQGTANQLLSALGLGGGLSSLEGRTTAAPSNAYVGYNNALLQALQAQNQAGNQGAAALAALTGQQGTALQTGLGAQMGQAQAMGLPYQTATGQAQNALNALMGQSNFGNQLLNLPQQSLNNLESYLQLGQSASQLGGQLGALGFGQQQQQLGQLGSLLNAGLGGGALGNLAFGSGGLSGALGLGSGGLLGGLGGGGAFTAGEAGSPFFVPGTDALLTTDTLGVGGGGGLLGAIGSLFGF